MTNNAVLSVRGLVKRFANRAVLRGMDLELAGGQVCALVGANGAGKTTAINVISGLLAPDAGTVRVNGTSPTAVIATLGVAPQEAALYPRLTCAENLAFFGSLFGMRGSSLRTRVDSVIQLARLSVYRNAHVATLSGGTRQRLNVGVAIINRPTLLILDEPTAGMDIEARHALWDMIRELRASGSAVLLTTHLLDEAAELCDRIALLHEGRIACNGTLTELCATVPAVQVAEVETEDEDSLRTRTAALGWRWQRRGGRLNLFLAEQTSLEVLMDCLRGTGIRSILLRPVGLEDVFFHTTGIGSIESSPDSRIHGQRMLSGRARTAAR